MKAITLEDIKKARENIKDKIQLTHINPSRSLSQWIGTETLLKLENQQITGSFKLRGATNKMMNLSQAEKAKGVVASSAGNHAQGVALAAKNVGCKAKIVMPIHSPLVKVLATQNYGAEVLLHGEIYDESYQRARELEKQEGLTFVHPYEDPLIIAGQGTLGLELLEQVPDMDSVIIPIGGGGLISGVATAIKAMKPNVKIFGAVPENTPGMFRMFKQEKADQTERQPTIADGLAVKKPSPEMYETYLKKLVDDVVTVGEDEIAEAIVMLLERAKAVVEGSGAVSLAAAKNAKLKLGKKTVIVLTGGNIDLNTISKVIERGLSKKGRLSRLSVIVSDRPGTLFRLTQVLAEKRANILQVNHDRLSAGLSMSETRIEFLIETRSNEHIAEIIQAFKDAGARVI